MKVLILANPVSSHTIKWVNSLSDSGIEIFLFGLNGYDKSMFNKDVKIEIFDISSKLKSNKDGSFSKIIYLTALKRIKDFVKKVRPDILHAHYVSSYGLLGALAGYHPFVISVWGTDIFYIPEKNIVNRKLIEFSLDKSDLVLSTSHIMAEQTKKFTHKEIEVIPFGIDTEKFKPVKTGSLFSNEDIVIGTVKTLEKKYGIENLIRSFKMVKDKLRSDKLKLLIVGGGTDADYFKNIVRGLNLEQSTIFTGYINPDKVHEYHNMLDIFVALSESESFGVSVLEASACEKPVVVSKAAGFTEIIKDNQAGFIVEKNDIRQAAGILLKLIEDRELRDRMGKAGRDNVLKFYNWNDNVVQMINVYKRLIN